MSERLLGSAQISISALKTIAFLRLSSLNLACERERELRVSNKTTQPKTKNILFHWIG